MSRVSGLGSENCSPVLWPFYGNLQPCLTLCFATLWFKSLFFLSNSLTKFDWSPCPRPNPCKWFSEGVLRSYFSCVGGIQETLRTKGVPNKSLQRIRDLSTILQHNTPRRFLAQDWKHSSTLASSKWSTSSGSRAWAK